MAKKKSRRALPWKRAAPKGSPHHALTPAGKTSARKRAKRAGRPYPNLVDNMRAAKKSKRRKTKAKTRKRSA